MMDTQQTNPAIIGTNNAERVLLAAAKHNIRGRLAQTVSVMACENTPFKYHVDHPVPPLAVDYLRLIVGGLHREVLCEWLMLTQQMGYRPQLDVLTLLLVEFLDAFDAQPLWIHAFRRLVGEDNIRVVIDILSATHHPKPQIRAIDAWFRAPPCKLKKVQWMWTGAMTEKFVHQQMRHYRWSDAVVEINDKAAFFDLSVASRTLDVAVDKRVQYIAHRKPNRASFYEHLKTALAIIDFRQRMVRAIETGR